MTTTELRNEPFVGVAQVLDLCSRGPTYTRWYLLHLYDEGEPLEQLAGIDRKLLHTFRGETPAEALAHARRTLYTSSEKLRGISSPILYEFLAALTCKAGWFPSGVDADTAARKVRPGLLPRIKQNPGRSATRSDGRLVVMAWEEPGFRDMFWVSASRMPDPIETLAGVEPTQVFEVSARRPSDAAHAFWSEAVTSLGHSRAVWQCAWDMAMESMVELGWFGGRAGAEKAVKRGLRKRELKERQSSNAMRYGHRHGRAGRGRAEWLAEQGATQHKGRRKSNLADPCDQFRTSSKPPKGKLPADLGIRTVDVGTLSHFYYKHGCGNFSQGSSGSRRLTVVDVRHPSEFYEGHIPGAINIPTTEIERSMRDGLLANFKGSLLTLVCKKGIRSGCVAKWLEGERFRVYSLEGGMEAWIAAGHDVESSPTEALAAAKDNTLLKKIMGKGAVKAGAKIGGKFASRWIPVAGQVVSAVEAAPVAFDAAKRVGRTSAEGAREVWQDVRAGSVKEAAKAGLKTGAKNYFETMKGIGRTALAAAVAREAAEATYYEKDRLKAKKNPEEVVKVYTAKNARFVMRLTHTVSPVPPTGISDRSAYYDPKTGEQIFWHTWTLELGRMSPEPMEAMAGVVEYWLAPKISASCADSLKFARLTGLDDLAEDLERQLKRDGFKP